MRRTIAEKLSFSGAGVHTGKKNFLTIHGAELGVGLVFRVDGVDHPISTLRRAPSRRNTTLMLPDGRALATVEHILSALVGLEVDDAIIETSAGEMPIMDGSAAAFVDAITSAGFVDREGERTQIRPPSSIVIADGSSFISCAPSARPRITYVIDYPGTPIGTQLFEIELSAAEYSRTAARARTFALESEVEAMRRAGLAMGGSLDNALVIGAEGPIGEGYRFEGECAAHKALDLIGDMGLLGTMPRAHIVCVRGGHSLHGRLVDRLRNFAAIS